MRLSRYKVHGWTGVAGVFAAFALTFGSSGAVSAAGVTCGPNNQACSFRVTVDGVQAGTGNYTIDPETGAITLVTAAEFEGDGWTASVDSVSGNADPILGFSASASTDGLGHIFSFAFDLPINLSGPQVATSAIGYTLTATTPVGARIQPIDDTVLTAFDLDTSVNGLGRLDKEVGAGDEFQFQGIDVRQSGIYRGGPTNLNLSPAYDTMGAVVTFGLSPSSEVGLSGFVQQVPEPSTYALLAAGLAFVAFVARRRLS